MDCSGACTCENNKVALSSFLFANLVTKRSGKVYSGHFEWPAPLCSVFWQSTCRRHSVWSGGEHFANIALLDNFLNFGSQLRYPPVLSHTCHCVRSSKMHDLIVCVNNKLLSKWSSRKVRWPVSFNSAFTLENTCMFISDQLPSRRL